MHLATLGETYPDLSLKIVDVVQPRRDMFRYELVTNTFTVTFIAVLETLISARIADGMTQTNHNQVCASFLCGEGVLMLVCGK